MAVHHHLLTTLQRHQKSTSYHLVLEVAKVVVLVETKGAWPDSVEQPVPSWEKEEVH
jgi:hypothetical protein